MKSILKFGLALLLCQESLLRAVPAVTVTNIAASWYDSFFVKSDGSLWAMGYNGYGELGDGTLSANGTRKPDPLSAVGVIAVAAGGYHTLFLKSDGSLWATGSDASGQLGDGTFNSTNQLEQIVPSGVMMIAAGNAHSLFLKTDGSLWAMGNNNYGQLGDGTLNTTNQPEQIIPNGVVAIAAGDDFSLFIKSDGSLWGMGYDGDGELGPVNLNVPSGTSLAEEIVSNGVAAIAAGPLGGHSLFIKTNGSLWGMGYNYYGQLGTNTLYDDIDQPWKIISNDVVAIAAGSDHSLFIKADGSLWGMGRNESGQLGSGTSGTYNDAYTPEQIVSSNVLAVAAGDSQSLFLKADGGLWAMGDDYYGELGDGLGGVAVLPERIVPSPQPILLERVHAKTNLQFNATCQFSGNFYLLMSTNLSQPLNQWSPLMTNSIVSRGTNNFSATLTNAVVSARQQFYILQSR